MAGGYFSRITLAVINAIPRFLPTLLVLSHEATIRFRRREENCPSYNIFPRFPFSVAHIFYNIRIR